MIHITREISFDAGHCLQHHLGFCQHMHGHRYRLLVTVSGDLKSMGSESGMITDFGFLKKLMMAHVHSLFDHKFIIQSSDPRAETMAKIQNENTVFLPEPPTVEILAELIFSIIEDVLPKEISLYRVKLYETPNNFAECYGEQ